MEARFEDARYEVRHLIGAGGFAEVYEAFDRQHRRLVALKIVTDEGDTASVLRLEREARALMSINHPNVCAVFDTGILDSGQSYMAMELLRGETLRAYFDRQEQQQPSQPDGKLSKSELADLEYVIDISSQLLCAIEAAHELGIVHRDVKPENIFLVDTSPSSSDGKRRPLVKLFDFGICRRLGMLVDSCTLTQAGCIIGSPEYMSPEQVSGSRTIDMRTDLFGAGMVLFEALAGHRINTGLCFTEIFVRLLAEGLPSLRSLRPSMPSAIEAVVSRATMPNPEDRYGDVRQFQHELLEARTAIRRSMRSQSLRGMRKSTTDFVVNGRAKSPSASGSFSESESDSVPTHRLPTTSSTVPLPAPPSNAKTRRALALEPFRRAS